MPKTLQVRRVRDEEERRLGSADYIQLDEGEKFLGYALFEGDPKTDEPGYYEYMEHWHQGSRRSVPCAGDDCPFCEDGDRPRNRAKSLWRVVRDEKGKDVDEIRIFNLNSKLIKIITELRGEGDKIKGQQFRVSLVSDRGDYMLQPKAGQTLKVSEVKEALKDAPDFEALMTSQLRKAHEGIAIARAMEDDEDEEPDEKPTKKGKAAPEPEEEEGEKEAGEGEVEWPADGDEEEVTVDEVDEENFLLASSESYADQAKLWGTAELDVTGFEEGDTITASWVTDADDDFVLTAADKSEEEAKEPEGGDDLPDEIEDVTCEIVSIDESESIMEVKADELDLEFTLYFLDTGPASKVDFEDYKPGDKIIVTAEKDTAGDLVATKIPEVAKAKKTGKGGKKGKS